MKQAVAGWLPGGLPFQRVQSNALLVSRKESTSGHPLAVMGPQGAVEIVYRRELQQAADVVVTVGEAEVEQVDGPRYEVWEIDESRQSNRVSAHVSGLLGTQRIALNDNLLRRCSLPEIEAVMVRKLNERMGEPQTGS